MTAAPGSQPTLTGWIASRRPPVPSGFARWMAPEEGDGPAGVESLVTEARRALHRTGREGRGTRRAAFDLLAADGFATWACEAALDGPDPEEALLGVLDALLE